MATGLFRINDDTVMVDYGTRKIAISRAQYRANGYRPEIEKLTEAPRGVKAYARPGAVRATDDLRIRRS